MNIHRKLLESRESRSRPVEKRGFQVQQYLDMFKFCLGIMEDMEKKSPEELRIQSRIVANKKELAMCKDILTDPLKLAYIENWYHGKGAKVPESFIEAHGLKRMG